MLWLWVELATGIRYEESFEKTYDQFFELKIKGIIQNFLGEQKA